MFPRYITPRIFDALSDTPVVLLHGARQTGKSTLVQHVISSGHPARYVTLDDTVVQAAARANPADFLAAFGGPVVIDEVQRVPELFLAIKAAVDRDHKAGRFLLTGSADILMLPHLAEFLAGRVEILPLWPLSQGEIAASPGNLIDPLFEARPPLVDAKGNDDSIPGRVLAGGFPEAISRSSARRRSAWFDSYLSTILERDVREMANIEGLIEMPRLLALLASRLCSLLNYAELSRSSGIPQTTLKRYMALLEAAFLVQTLPAWSGNLSHRLTKSPKLLLCDTGLAAHLMGLEQPTALPNHPAGGALLECFVAMDLQKQATWSETSVRLYHYRTSAGQDVDLVLERPDGAVVGVEVKSSSTVTVSDFKGLRLLQEQLGSRFRCGVVLYRGFQSIPFSEQLWAVPVQVLWK